MASCHPDRKHRVHGLCTPCYDKKRYKDHPEKSAANHQKWASNNPERVKELNRQWYAQASVAHLLHKSAKTRAKKRGLAFDLDVADVRVPSHCPLLKIPLEKGRRN